MNIIKKTSPNFAYGRDGHKPDAIVIHIMDGSLTGTDSWFASPSSGVSAHFGIGFKGEVHQYVEEQNTAWANGRVDNPKAKLVVARPTINPNKYTISIEHEGSDLSKAPLEQLKVSGELVKYIATKYGIPLTRDYIYGHREIYSKKTNCPSNDLRVIETIIEYAKAEEIVNVPVPKSKVDKVLAYLKTI